MRHPNPSDSGVPCEPSGTSTLWSFSVSQGLHLHVSDQTTGSSPRAPRKYDFRLLTPSTVGSFHKRGLAGSGITSPDTRAKGVLVACGKRCVLSLRPERCKAENEKPKGAEESERGESAANGAVGEQRKIGEGKKRAQSGVVRTRVMVMSDTRPSTAPAHTQSGRGDTNRLTPGTPGYRMVWRSSENSHHDDPDCTSTGLHLDLYLPNYPPEPRKEADEVETERQDADTDGQIVDNQTQQHLEVCNDGNRGCDITGGSPDAVEDNVTMETGSEQKHKMEEEDKDGGQDEFTEKEENEQHGVTETSSEIAQEPTEECTRAVEERSGKTDDPPQSTAATHQNVLEERQKAPGAKLKSGAAHVRNSETKMTRRLMLPPPALSFPGTLSRTRSSPLPLFGIRMPHAPDRHRAKTQPTAVGFYRRRIKPATERPPSLEKKGSWHILKTDTGGINGTRPKIMSSECGGCLPRKTKTTKTFVWGPQGPQETKSVSELHTRTDRWRGSD